MVALATGWQSLTQDAVAIIRADYAALRTTINLESSMSGYSVPAISSDGYEVKGADGRHLPQADFFVNVRATPDVETLGIASGVSRQNWDLRVVVGIRHQTFGAAAGYPDTAAWPEDAALQVLGATARCVLNALVAGLPAKTGVYNVLQRPASLIPPETKRPVYRVELRLTVGVFTQNAWS